MNIQELEEELKDLIDMYIAQTDAQDVDIAINMQRGNLWVNWNFNLEIEEL